MNKIVLLILAALLLPGIRAQQPANRLTFAATLGTGFALDKPSVTPFTGQISGHYHFNNRFSAGIGSGVSVYKKAVIPLFADVKFTLTKSRKFTPFLECGAGYGFAPGKDAKGGMYLNPSVGVQYALRGTKKIALALGYERQDLERVKKQEHPLFTAEFTEKLRHNLISVKVGFLF